MRKNGPKSPRTGHSKQTVRLKKKPAINRHRTFATRLDESMYLEADELRRLFSVIESKRDLAIFRVAYHRGLRAHEIGLLKYADFDGHDRLYVRRGKGSRSGEHVLANDEARALRAWIKERGRKPGPLFPSRKHGPIRRSRLDELMKYYCRLAEIPAAKAHMHALKHSCGTQLAEAGKPAEDIKEWLGHKEISSTQIYMHFTKRRRMEMFESMRDWK